MRVYGQRARANYYLMPGLSISSGILPSLPALVVCCFHHLGTPVGPHTSKKYKTKTYSQVQKRTEPIPAHLPTTYPVILG